MGFGTLVSYVLYLTSYLHYSLSQTTMATPNNFFTQLESRMNAVNSHLCVGLDPHLKELFPNSTKHMDEYSEEEISNASYEFCKRIIDATGEYENINHLGLSSFKGVGWMKIFEWY